MEAMMSCEKQDEMVTHPSARAKRAISAPEPVDTPCITRSIPSDGRTEPSRSSMKRTDSVGPSPTVLSYKECNDENDREFNATERHSSCSDGLGGKGEQGMPEYRRSILKSNTNDSHHIIDVSEPTDDESPSLLSMKESAKSKLVDGESCNAILGTRQENPAISSKGDCEIVAYNGHDQNSGGPEYTQTTEQTATNGARLETTSSQSEEFPRPLSLVVAPAVPRILPLPSPAIAPFLSSDDRFQIYPVIEGHHDASLSAEPDLVADTASRTEYLAAIPTSSRNALATIDESHTLPAGRALEAQIAALVDESSIVRDLTADSSAVSLQKRPREPVPPCAINGRGGMAFTPGGIRVNDGEARILTEEPDPGPSRWSRWLSALWNGLRKSVQCVCWGDNWADQSLSSGRIVDVGVPEWDDSAIPLRELLESTEAEAPVRDVSSG